MYIYNIYRPVTVCLSLSLLSPLSSPLSSLLSPSLPLSLSPSLPLSRSLALSLSLSLSLCLSLHDYYCFLLLIDNIVFAMSAFPRGFRRAGPEGKTKELHAPTHLHGDEGQKAAE